MCYELMRAKHFVNKLELLIDNCPRKSLNENAQLRVSVPHFQTKDAIEQIQLHLDEIAKHIEKGKLEQDYWFGMATSGDPERFAWEHGQEQK